VREQRDAEDGDGGGGGAVEPHLAARRARAQHAIFHAFPHDVAMKGQVEAKRSADDGEQEGHDDAEFVDDDSRELGRQGVESEGIHGRGRVSAFQK